MTARLISWLKAEPWIDDIVSTLPPQTPAQPGRDCPACVCARDCHDGYGCVCGCALSIALVTWRRYAP